MLTRYRNWSKYCDRLEKRVIFGEKMMAMELVDLEENKKEFESCNNIIEFTIHDEDDEEVAKYRGEYLVGDEGQPIKDGFGYEETSQYLAYGIFVQDQRHGLFVTVPKGTDHICYDHFVYGEKLGYCAQFHNFGCFFKSFESPFGSTGIVQTMDMISVGDQPFGIIKVTMNGISVIGHNDGDEDRYQFLEAKGEVLYNAEILLSPFKDSIYGNTRYLDVEIVNSEVDGPL